MTTITVPRAVLEQALKALVARGKRGDGSPDTVAALRAALAQQGCTYTVKEMDGFGTLWTTECGEGLYVAAPEAIGFSLAPMPNADGKFCRFCGNKIIIEDKK